MPTRKATPPDPDKLIRQEAGAYRTPDDRFEARSADQGWFLVDAEQTDDFGQPLVRGPYPTLKAVSAAVPEARNAGVDARPRPKPATPASRATGSRPKARPKPKPSPQPSWIDALPPADASAVRRLIGALEAQGVERAEQLVRRDREGIAPVIATTLVERALAELLAEATTEEREAARKAVALLTEGGRGARGVLPGWSLVEIGPEPDPPNRRLAPRMD
jgi:hypothetical protein